MGLDLWDIKELAQCNVEDLDKLAKLFREWDIEVTAPSQWLVNLMAMIPKKKRAQNGSNNGKRVQSVHRSG